MRRGQRLTGKFGKNRDFRDFSRRVKARVFLLAGERIAQFPPGTILIRVVPTRVFLTTITVA
eukprot:31089-Pelagococcus_subviridis.AAC.19